jgi:hypothetical protein
MGQVAHETETVIYAWALMTDHAHILLFGKGLYNPLGRSSPAARSFYVCHFQGNYKENERVGQASQLGPQFPTDHIPLI